jgi:hypothetical protein
LLIALGVSTSSLGADARLSRSTAVAALAVSRPCLATLLVYFNGQVVHSGKGVLRLSGIPTQRSVIVLLDTVGGMGRAADDVVTQWSPYSDDTFMVEIQWTVSVMQKGIYYVSARAEILDGLGASLTPRHIIEPSTTAFVTAHSLRVVENPKVL